MHDQDEESNILGHQFEFGSLSINTNGGQVTGNATNYKMKQTYKMGPLRVTNGVIKSPYMSFELGNKGL